MEIVKDVVIGVVSGYAALYFALKRFYFEKMWERKEAAYSSIFEALHHLKNHVDHQLAAEKVDERLAPKGRKSSRRTEKKKGRKESPRLGSVRT